MSDIPDWIEQRIDSNIQNKLTQRHVVETMLDAERPFFSIRQLQSRLKPDVQKGTIRNRLNELREIDVVAAEEYPDTITLYYINYPESNWPLSPESRQMLVDGSPIESLSVTGVLTLQDSVGIQRLVAAGFRLSALLFGLGLCMGLLGVKAPISGGHRMWTAAYLLFAVCLLLLAGERIASSIRTEGWSALVPTADRLRPK